MVYIYRHTNLYVLYMQIFKHEEAYKNRLYDLIWRDTDMLKTLGSLTILF